jgi:hypothetical protein
MVIRFPPLSVVEIFGFRDRLKTPYHESLWNVGPHKWNSTTFIQNFNENTIRFRVVPDPTDISCQCTYMDSASYVRCIERLTHDSLQSLHRKLILIHSSCLGLTPRLGYNLPYLSKKLANHAKGQRSFLYGATPRQVLGLFLEHAQHIFL